eukprot:scaffold51279_cov55-Attheya_sp.AAC.2
MHPTTIRIVPFWHLPLTRSARPVSYPVARPIEIEVFSVLPLTRDPPPVTRPWDKRMNQDCRRK